MRFPALRFSSPILHHCLALWLSLAPLAFSFAKDELPPLRFQQLRWDFPIQRPHAGVPLANGRQGILVWGQGNQLYLTVGHQGFWDHRGGRNLAQQELTYDEVKRVLATGSDTAIRNRLTGGLPGMGAGVVKNFQQLGGGRLCLTLPDGWQLQHANLNLTNAVLEVTATTPRGVPQQLIIRQSVGQDVAWVRIPASLRGRMKIRFTPAYYLTEGAMAARGIAPPDTFIPTKEKESLHGFIQRLPADEPLVMLAKQRGEHLLISSKVGAITENESASLLQSADLKALNHEANDWWQAYWQSVPRLNLPDAKLQEVAEYGLYMQGSCTPPHGLAASLQGPLLEDYQLPPWAADYHWNINVQMLYWPALSTGRAENMKPLWDLLLKLLPQMQANGKQFFGKEGALLLPHATDDRGQYSGSFWSGLLDLGCQAWLGQMSWQYYQYTGDTEHLRSLTWPLLKGAFTSYQAMLKDTNINGKPALTLPISVSPEWRGSQVSSVGRNASFQLAAIHSLCQLLPKAAAVLNQGADPEWQRVQVLLPPYTSVTGPKVLEYPQYQHKRIAIFEGQDLIESHRHHSHLAGVYPFMTLAPFDTTGGQNGVIAASFYNWLRKGAGSWTGWCIPWASALCSRLHQPDAAISWLHHWNQNYVNEGRGTLHDANWAGISTAFKTDPYRQVLTGGANKEVMQLDARMGSLQAVLEILVQQGPEVCAVLPVVPRNWRNFSFRNITVAGGFKVSALVRNGEVVELVVLATRPGMLQLQQPIGKSFYLNDELLQDQQPTMTLTSATGNERWWFRKPGFKKYVKLVEWR